MPENEQKKNKSNPLTWLGGGAVMLLFKGKAILSLLKIGKIAGPLISMMVSIWLYAQLYPWGFAIGFVLLLLVHELGHVIAAKRIGLPVSAPLFIPFLGALITMKKQPLDAKEEAYVAIGGPILGTIGATAVLEQPTLWIVHSYALAYIGFVLNLINLLPIHPLDGGRIATAVTRWLWLVGLVGGLAVIIYLRSILFFIIWALFAYDLYKKYFKNRIKKQENKVIRGFMIPVEHLRYEGYMIPGPEHRRDLPFTTYSDLKGQQYVGVSWDSLGYEGTAKLPQQCIIEKVRISRLEQVYLDDGLHLKMDCDINYTVFENDKYYDVPAHVRWKYGTAYFVLAGFLMGMMYMVHVVGNLNL